MEAYTSTLGLRTQYIIWDSLTDSLIHWLICPNYAFVSHLKIVPGFRACCLIPENGKMEMIFFPSPITTAKLS